MKTELKILNGESRTRVIRLVWDAIANVRKYCYFRLRPGGLDGGKHGLQGGFAGPDF